MDLHRVETKVDPAVRADDDLYYHPTRSCQIPNLGFLYELFLGRQSDGVFVEVGAFDGISWSNTSCLAEVGWRGLLIEPVPEFAEQCRSRYAGNELIEVIQCAAGASDAQIKLMVGGSLTTASEALAAEYRDIEWSKSLAERMVSIEVRQARLDDLLAERGIEPGFDVIVVDVEGFEAEVFAGFSIERWRPRMLIVELADTHPDLVTTRGSDAVLSRSITSAGYDIVYKDSINTMFVRRD